MAQDTNVLCCVLPDSTLDLHAHFADLERKRDGQHAMHCVCEGTQPPCFEKDVIRTCATSSSHCVNTFNKKVQLASLVPGEETGFDFGLADMDRQTFCGSHDSPYPYLAALARSSSNTNEDKNGIVPYGFMWLLSASWVQRYFLRKVLHQTSNICLPLKTS